MELESRERGKSHVTVHWSGWDFWGGHMFQLWLERGRQLVSLDSMPVSVHPPSYLTHHLAFPPSARCVFPTV